MCTHFYFCCFCKCSSEKWILLWNAIANLLQVCAWTLKSIFGKTINASINVLCSRLQGAYWMYRRTPGQRWQICLTNPPFQMWLLHSPCNTTLSTDLGNNTSINTLIIAGYKKHTDCTIGAQDKRDRFATILVYLDDVEEGGETKFPGRLNTYLLNKWKYLQEEIF